MPTYQFSDVEGVMGTPALPANQLVNIRQLVTPPPGEHLNLLTRLALHSDLYRNDPQAAIYTTRNSRTIFAIEDANLLEGMDAFFMNTRAPAGARLNVITGKADGTAVNGASLVRSSLALNGRASHTVTDGISSYLDLNLEGNAQHFTLNNACVWVYLEETPPATAATNPILGQTGETGNDNFRFYRNSAAPYHQTRLNSAAISYSFPEEKWGPGLWMIERTDANTVSIYKNNELLFQTDQAPATTRASSIVVGRNYSVYAAQRFSFAGYGAAMSASKKATMLEIMNAHRRVI